MSLENIRKIWVLVGTLLAAMGASWLPGIVGDLFSAEGTDLVFRAITAVMALYQFSTKRTGKANTPQTLSTNGTPIGYVLNPFKSV